MRSFQEMVVSQMKQMSEDNQQLLWFKSRIVKEQITKKVMVEQFSVMTEKLRRTMDENRVVKLKTKKHHEQNKEEVCIILHALSEQDLSSHLVNEYGSMVMKYDSCNHFVFW